MASIAGAASAIRRRFEDRGHGQGARARDKPALVSQGGWGVEVCGAGAGD